MKSVANYETYIAQKREVDKITEENLTYIQSKLNEGYNRSIQQKEQVKWLAACSLSKIGEVMENQKKRKQSIEAEVILNFIEHKDKYNK